MRFAASVAVVVVLLVAHIASASPSRDFAPAAARNATRFPNMASASGNSRSVGFPWEGRLERGVRLNPSAYVRHVGEYRTAGRFFGTSELVGLLERAAQAVHRRFPGAKLSVGELSRDRGGRVSGHDSHQNGRDADVSFYMSNTYGHPFDAFTFVQFDGSGKGRYPNRDLRFDDQRNWELVSLLLEDRDARVQYIFVSDPLRRRLLTYGRNHGATSALLDRASAAMMQPDGHPHANHFHVRIYCPLNDRPACKDGGPIYSWYQNSWWE